MNESGQGIKQYQLTKPELKRRLNEIYNRQMLTPQSSGRLVIGELYDYNLKRLDKTGTYDELIKFARSRQDTYAKGYGSGKKLGRPATKPKVARTPKPKKDGTPRKTRKDKGQKRGKRQPKNKTAVQVLVKA